MADDITIAGKTIALDEVSIEGSVKLVTRDKVGWGSPGTYQDVDAANPLPITDSAAATTLTAVLAKLSADPATQTTLAAVLTALQGTVATAPATAGDVAGTVTNGRKTVAAAGTPEALRATLACRWVQVTALLTNTQQVNVGGTGVSAASGSSSGAPLLAGDSITVPVNDAAKVFVDARVTGEGVSFLVGV